MIKCVYMKNIKPKSEIIIYQSADGTPKIEVQIENETVWLTQAQLAELFNTSRPNITMHIKNKLHYAAHGNTASEVIVARANAGKPFMGLLSFSDGGVSKKDIAIAKNYLDEKELKVLNNIVSAFFDLAEVRAMEHEPMYMKDWIAQLDKLIGVFDKKVLTEAGSVSHSEALKKAEVEYKKFQAKTLSPVEKAYLENIKLLEKKGEKKKKEKK